MDGPEPSGDLPNKANTGFPWSGPGDFLVYENESPLCRHEPSLVDFAGKPRLLGSMHIDDVPTSSTLELKGTPGYNESEACSGLDDSSKSSVVSQRTQRTSTVGSPRRIQL